MLIRPRSDLVFILSLIFLLYTPSSVLSDQQLADVENSVFLLKILSGYEPHVAFEQIRDINNDGQYGMPEIISLLAGTNQIISNPSGSIGMPTWTPVLPVDAAIGTSEIAFWKYGKRASMTVSYDDSAIGNALHGVPGMHERGLVGTWFVNPGNDSFLNQAEVWHEAVFEYRQEIANHTMYHQGGTTEETAIAAIDDASAYIKEHIYQVSPSSNFLLGFNKAGGTAWDIDTTSPEWDQRIRDLYLFERKHSTGFYKAMPFAEMKNIVRAGFYDSTDWRSIHFHGICDDTNNGNPNPAYWPSYIENCTCTHVEPTGCGEEPVEGSENYDATWAAWAICRFSSGYTGAAAVTDCTDGGTGAVKKTEIYKFYDYLVDPEEMVAQEIWVAGYIEAKKYEVTRNNSTIEIVESTENTIRLNLSLTSVDLPSPLNQPSLYDEEITIFTKVPDNWSACRVSQAGVSHTYRISGDEARFEALPNGGEITLSNDLEANVDIPYVGQPVEQSVGGIVGLTGHVNETSLAELSWTAAENAAYYRIFRKKIGDTSFDELSTTDSTTFVVTNTTSGSGYFNYAIEGCNISDVCGETSSPVTLYTPQQGDVVYFVSTEGNDANSGSFVAPWQSIQKAADTLPAGATVIIRDGMYNEQITMNNSGLNSDGPTRFVSEILHGAKSGGIAVKGNYLTIDGLDIESDGMGIELHNVDSVTISNCYIHECPLYGISFYTGQDYIGVVNNANILNNTIEHCAQVGIRLTGNHNLVKSNRILDIIERHPKWDPGDYGGDDADGMQLFGSNHTISNNQILRYGDSAIPGEINAPHADCIQSWNNPNPQRPDQALRFSVIENNHCVSSHASAKGIIIEAPVTQTGHQKSQDIIIRNNIFEYRDIGISASTGQFENYLIYNNLFKAQLNDTSWGVGISLKDVIGYDVRNNITVDCHPENIMIRGGSGGFSNNYFYHSNGDPTRVYLPDPDDDSKTILTFYDLPSPEFVKYTGVNGENDYHLQNISPLIDGGINLDDVTQDMDGGSRPPEELTDIGPYEYSNMMDSYKIRSTSL